MFKIIILFIGLMISAFFWQDISPYFQLWTDKIDTFMLGTNELIEKLISVFEDNKETINQVQEQLNESSSSEDSSQNSQ